MTAMPTRVVLLLLCVALSVTAYAKHMYQYTDAQGVVHYTDVKPSDDVVGVKSTLVHADRQPLIRLRQDGPDADRSMAFINSAGGPVSVDISFAESSNVRTEPPLPARLVLQGNSETQVLRVLAADPNAGFGYSFKYSYMPGDYRAHHDDTARYHMPFSSQRKFPVAQAFGGAASHTDPQNHYAVDIGMPEGTPVLAARDGVVMTVDSDFYGTGLDMAKYGDRANNIRIVHADGTMAVYAHLQLESAQVHVGDRVRAGQELALSGNTGYASGPHLHFCVQVNSEMNLVSVPFQFTGADGDFIPTVGMVLSGQ